LASAAVRDLRVLISAGMFTAPIRTGGLLQIGRASESFFLGGQFLFEGAHFFEEFKGFKSGFLVDLGERKPNVHNGVVTYNDLGHVVEADILDHSAEIHAADPNVAFNDLFDPTGDS
jgi:hypothetical protein